MLLPFSQHVLMARWIWLATGEAIYLFATLCYLEESRHDRMQSSRARVKMAWLSYAENLPFAKFDISKFVTDK